MRLHGHEGTIRFRGINSEFLYGQVLAGENGAVPGPTETPLHGPGLSTAQGRGPSRRPLREGDAVVIDISGLSEGYVSDQTRTFFVGRADPDAARGLRHLPPRSSPRAWSCCGPARRGAPLFERAAEIAAEAGHAERFMGAGEGRVKFVGHCIGLELNEPPYLARGYDQPLEVGQRRRDRAQAGVRRARRRRRREQLPARRGRAGAAHGRDGGARDRVIDAALYRRLFAELAAIGREPGGWNRMAWGPGEDAARAWFRATRRRARARARAGSRRQPLGRRAGRGRGAVRRGRLARRLGRRRGRVRRRARGRRRSRRGRGRSPRRGRAAAARRRRHGRRGGAALRRGDLRLARALRRARRRRRARAHRSGGQRAARSRRAARRDRGNRARGARVPGARRVVDRGARRAGARARRRSRAARASRRRWRRASAGAARCAASPTTPARPPWPGGAMRWCPPRAPCWQRTSSPSPSRARSRPWAASARCRARPTRCPARRA